MTRLQELKFSIALIFNLCGGLGVWLVAGAVVSGWRAVRITPPSQLAPTKANGESE